MTEEFFVVGILTYSVVAQPRNRHFDQAKRVEKSFAQQTLYTLSS
jgi:hypothetical protein